MDPKEKIEAMIRNGMSSEAIKVEMAILMGLIPDDPRLDRDFSKYIDDSFSDDDEEEEDD